MRFPAPPWRARVTLTSRVLFVCIENACRSLMAEAIFNADAPPGWTAVSAGTQPAAAPNPKTASMLAEIGLELPSHAPALLTSELVDSAEVRVTMGCLDSASCPARLRTLEVRDWGIPDPARLDVDGFRRVRDQLVAKIGDLRSELLAAERPGGGRRRSAPR